MVSVAVLLPEQKESDDEDGREERDSYRLCTNI